jgi:hypothetical protein
MRITLSPEKSFPAYPLVELLGHRVDGLGMATTAERVRAIQNLEFTENPKALERYLGMTGYLQQYVPWYAQLVQPLQDRKTQLLAVEREQGATGTKRRGFVARTRWYPTLEEWQSLSMTIHRRIK